MDRPIGYRIRGPRARRARSCLVGACSAMSRSRPEPDGTTVISGELGDQSAVHGLLDAIRDLGMSLVSVEAAAISRR